MTILPDHPTWGTPRAMFPTILGLELGYVYTVARTPLKTGDAFTQVVTVEQVVHQFDQVSWSTTLDLGAADTDPYFTADDDFLGLVDVGNLVAY